MKSRGNAVGCNPVSWVLLIAAGVSPGPCSSYTLGSILGCIDVPGVGVTEHNESQDWRRLEYSGTSCGGRNSRYTN